MAGEPGRTLAPAHSSEIVFWFELYWPYVLFVYVQYYCSTVCTVCTVHTDLLQCTCTKCRTYSSRTYIQYVQYTRIQYRTSCNIPNVEEFKVPHQPTLLYICTISFIYLYIQYTLYNTQYLRQIVFTVLLYYILVLCHKYCIYCMCLYLVYQSSRQKNNEIE